MSDYVDDWYSMRRRGENFSLSPWSGIQNSPAPQMQIPIMQQGKQPSSLSMLPQLFNTLNNGNGQSGLHGLASLAGIGQTSSNGQQSFGVLQSDINPSLSTMANNYTPNQSKVDPTGNPLAYQYDPNGNPWAKVLPVWESSQYPSGLAEGTFNTIDQEGYKWHHEPGKLPYRHQAHVPDIPGREGPKEYRQDMNLKAWEYRIPAGKTVHADDIPPLSRQQAIDAASPSILGPGREMNKAYFNKIYNQPRPIILEEGAKLEGYDQNIHKHIGQTYSLGDWNKFPNPYIRRYEQNPDNPFNQNMLVEGREEGGPVQAGVPYIVGEKQPEVFVPSQDGVIMPSVNSQLSPDSFMPQIRNKILARENAATTPLTLSQMGPSQGNSMVGSMPSNRFMPQQQTKQEGLYDYWRKPILGSLPRDRFVQLTGLIAHALSPNSFGGRMGAGLAQIGGQAEQERLGYEERTAEKDEQRAWKSKEWEALRQEKVAERNAALFGNKNIPLSVRTQAGKSWIAYYNKNNPDYPISGDISFDDKGLPEFMSRVKERQNDPNITPEKMNEMNIYDGIELGLIPADKITEAYKKPSTETWQTGYRDVLKGGKTYRQYFKYDKRDGTEILDGQPVPVKEQSIHIHTGGRGGGGGMDKSTRQAISYVNNYIRKTRADRAKWYQRAEKYKGTADGEKATAMLDEFDRQLAIAHDTLSGLQDGSISAKDVQWPKVKKTASYKSADDVKAAYKAGELSQNDAATILRNSFGYK